MENISARGANQLQVNFTTGVSINLNWGFDTFCENENNTSVQFESFSVSNRYTHRYNSKDVQISFNRYQHESVDMIANKYSQFVIPGEELIFGYVPLRTAFIIIEELGNY